VALHVLPDMASKFGNAFYQRAVPVTPVGVKFLAADSGLAARADDEFYHGLCFRLD
jgi:hypothetical protein